MEKRGLSVVGKGGRRGGSGRVGLEIVFLAIRGGDETVIALFVVALPTVSKINPVRGKAEAAEPNIHPDP